MLALIGLFLLASPARAEESCVEVVIGGERTPNLGCLNTNLRAQVERVGVIENIAPLDAASPAVKVGGYNEAAMKQQYGPNYGKSVIPWRPATSFVNRLR